MAQQESRLRGGAAAGSGCAARARAPGRELAVRRDRVVVDPRVRLRFQPLARGDLRGVSRGGPLHDHPGAAVRGPAGCSRLRGIMTGPASIEVRLRTLADVFAICQRPRACTCASTAPRCRSAALWRTGPGGGRSCRGRRSGRPFSPWRSGGQRPAAMARRAPPRPHAGRAPRCGTGGHRGPAPALPDVTGDVRSGIGPWPTTSSPRSPPSLRSRRPAPHTGQIIEQEAARNSSPHGGSASSTPSPSQSDQGPCSATSGAASTSQTQPRPSPGESPIAPPNLKITGPGHSRPGRPRPQSRPSR